MRSLALRLRASQNLPFRLWDQGTITFTGPTTATTTGTGNAIHMGRITSDGSLTIVGQPTCGTGVGFAAQMRDTFTAANGDKLMTAITMQLCPIVEGIYHGVGTYVVTGGTGRFAGAIGSGVFDGTGNFGSRTIICALNGTISLNYLSRGYGGRPVRQIGKPLSSRTNNTGPEVVSAFHIGLITAIHRAIPRPNTT